VFNDLCFCLVIQTNVSQMARSPRYAQYEEDKVVTEVLAKINKRERSYEPLEAELRYIKIGSGVSSSTGFYFVE
jgi:hypothetical protein